MATRTISATGGNWNATTAWVDGIVPVDGDNVIGNSTSGNIKINVRTANLRNLDFSDYLGTVTLDQVLVLGVSYVQEAATFSFSPTMSWTTSTSYDWLNRAVNWNSAENMLAGIKCNGTKIPFLTVYKGGGPANINLLDDLNVTSMYLGLGNRDATFVGTYSINVNHFIRGQAGGGNVGSMIATQSTVKFVGPTASFTQESTTCPQVWHYTNVQVDVGADGTFSTYGGVAVPYHSDSAAYGPNNTFKWVSGKLGGDKTLSISQYSPYLPYESGLYKLDLSGAGTWSKVLFNPSGITNGKNLVLQSDLKFDEFLQAEATAHYSWTSTPWNLYGPLTLKRSTGALKGGKILMFPIVNDYPGTGLIGKAGFWSPTYSTPFIRLNPGYTHTFTDIKTLGYDKTLGLRSVSGASQSSNLAYICSATAGTKATVQFLGTQSAPSYWVFYEDIDASSGNTIYNYQGDQKNSLNIGTISMGESITTVVGGSSTYIL